MTKSCRSPSRTSQRSSSAPYSRPTTPVTPGSSLSVPPGAIAVVAHSGERPRPPGIDVGPSHGSVSQHSPNALYNQSVASTSTQSQPLVPIVVITGLTSSGEESSIGFSNNAITGHSSERGTPRGPTHMTSQLHTAHNLNRFEMDDDHIAPLSSNVAAGGFFPYSSGFYFHKPVMNEIHHGPEVMVLEKMVKHIIPGTEFDSSERDDPPRCHPDTRTDFLKQLQMRIHDATLGTRIVWLVGPAGVGKSAIMQSLAEVVSPLPTLRCATLFFSRPNHRDDPKKVFTTLAYGFAVAEREYRRYMGEKLAVDPTFLDKSLDEQFKRLFITPFTTKSVDPGSQRWVVILDGLDECNGEKEQCRIVDLIHESTVRHAQATPFIWIIASRPEAHLQASFRPVEKLTGFWKLEVPIDSEEALRSVERYLRTEFTKIRDHYSDIVPSLWPSENDFLQLTKTSSGLFIFSSTLVDYIGKENPVQRLRHILSLIDQTMAGRQDPSHEVERNPFYALDILYTTIMSDVPPSSLPVAKTILGFYLLGDVVARVPPDFLDLCNTLGLERHDAYAALRKLHSVLSFPSPGTSHTEPVRFLHASFSDFLKDRLRSQSYYVDLDQELGNIWRCYANVIKLAPVKALRDYIILSWEPTSFGDKQELRDSVQERAQRFWFMILVRFCHDALCQHVGMQHRLSYDIAEIIEVFEELGPELFERKGGESFNDDIGSFCDWLSNHAPVAFRQRMVSREYSLTQLSERDLDYMFTGLCERNWAFYYLHNRYLGAPMWWPTKFDLGNLNIDRWDQLKQLALNQNKSVTWEARPLNWSVLTNLLILRRRPSVESNQAAKVTVVRIKPMEHYAIIGPLHIAISSIDNLEYLVFPYVEG